MSTFVPTTPALFHRCEIPTRAVDPVEPWIIVCSILVIIIDSLNSCGVNDTGWQRDIQCYTEECLTAGDCGIGQVKMSTYSKVCGVSTGEGKDRIARAGFAVPGSTVKPGKNEASLTRVAQCGECVYPAPPRSLPKTYNTEFFSSFNLGVFHFSVASALTAASFSASLFEWCALRFIAGLCSTT